MRLPIMSNVTKETRVVGTFGGINQSAVIGENEFADMLNMSSKLYPAIGPRDPRGIVEKTLTKPNGMHFNNGLLYVDDTNVYFNGSIIGTVEDSKKQMVSMGAYVVILPDKKVYNTHTGEWKAMEAAWTQSATATFTPTVSASTFIRISCTGIGAKFNKGDGVTISGCTNAAFNKTTVIQSAEANSIVVIAELNAEFSQASGLTIKRTVPDMDYITESENRLWGCSSENHEVYASKLGDPFNWNCFEGISTDSYAATIGSDGRFTGIASYLGYVLFFKEGMIHKVYGNKPSNIQINGYPGKGVKEGCSGSICIANETLFFASPEGICAYDGSTPYLVSEKLKNAYIEAVAGHEKGKYYISMHTDAGWELYVFDTMHGLWHKEDDTQIVTACYGSGTMYYIDGANNLRTISGNDASVIEWCLESGDQEDGSLNSKRLHKLQLMIDLEAGAYAEVYLSYENNPLWKRVKTIAAGGKRSIQLSLRPHRCTHYRYKISGFGQCKIYGLAKEINHGTGR